MTEKSANLEQVIWETRRLFQLLASEGNDLLGPFNITASQRAVLEFLKRKEPQTLANIARDHDVSRQHIQQIMNDLLAKNLVETLENPAHKRSFLVQHTDVGKALFEKLKQRESDLFDKIGREFDSGDLALVTSSRV